jgi:hypothetical protein
MWQCCAKTGMRNPRSTWVGPNSLVAHSSLSDLFYFISKPMLCVQPNPSGHRTKIYTPINFLKVELSVHQAWLLSQYLRTPIFTPQRHSNSGQRSGKCSRYQHQQLPGTKHHAFIEIYTLLHVSAILEIIQSWYMIWYDIFNCNWVDTRWQQYSSHLHTNSTQNTPNRTYITITKLNMHNNKN